MFLLTFIIKTRFFYLIILRIDASDDVLVQQECIDAKVAVSDRIRRLVGIYSRFESPKILILISLTEIDGGTSVIC